MWRTENQWEFMCSWWLSENFRKNKSRPQDSREYSKEMELSCTAEHVNSELSTIFTGDPLCPVVPRDTAWCLICYLNTAARCPLHFTPGSGSGCECLWKVWEGRDGKGNDAKIFVSWRWRWNLPRLTLGWNEAEHHWISLMQLSPKWRMEVKIKDSPRWLHIYEVF